MSLLHDQMDDVIEDLRASKLIADDRLRLIAVMSCGTRLMQISAAHLVGETCAAIEALQEIHPDGLIRLSAVSLIVADLKKSIEDIAPLGAEVFK